MTIITQGLNIAGLTFYHFLPLSTTIYHLCGVSTIV